MRSPRRSLHLLIVVALSVATVSCSDDSGGAGGKQRPAAGEETLTDLVADITLLPAPLPAPAPEKRYEYAQKVTGGAPDGLAALIALVQAAGITIIDSNAPGTVIEPTGPSMGLGIEASGLRAAFALEQQQWSVELNDLADVLMTNLELPITAEELSALIVADLDAATGLPEPVATWSQTIKALGSVYYERTDLGDGLLPFYGGGFGFGSSTNVRIGATQTLLIMARLAGDLHVAADADPAAPPATNPGPPTVVHPGQAAQPCTLGSTQATILDGVALGTTYGFGKVLEFFGESFPAGELYGEFLTKAAIVSTIMKFLWTTAAFETKIELVDGPPLLRTTDRNAGQDRTLKATFTMNIGKAAWMNCARVLLNGVTGLDFSLPNDGPLSGNSVDWTLTEGRDVVQLCNQGCGGTGSAIEGTTADDGSATNIVQGKPHRRAVDKTLEVTRHATVRADIALKDPQLIQDLIDAISAATAGPAGLVVVFTTEQLYRLHIWGASVRFPVTDHAEKLTFDVKAEGVLRDELFISREAASCSSAASGTYTFSMQFTTGTQRFEVDAASMVMLLNGDAAAGNLRMNANVNADATDNIVYSGGNACAGGDGGPAPAADCGPKSGQLPLLLAMQVSGGELHLYPGANPLGGLGTEPPWKIYENCWNGSDLLGQATGKLTPEQLLGEEPFSVAVETTLRESGRRTTEIRWKVTFTPILEKQP